MSLISTTKSKSDFGRRVRGLARGLWNDSIDFMSFVDGLTTAVFRAYEQAWREGSATCGITAAERTTEESRVLDRELNLAYGSILGFADFIEAHKKRDGQLLRTNVNRAAIWTNRYSAVVALAQATSCSDRKGTWRLGKTRDHCGSCLGLAGRTYRMSVWRANNAVPQGRNLECGGWRCECSIELTDDRVTPGPFPRRLLT